MSKIKSRTWSSRPSTTQSGVLNYSTLKAKKRRIKSKTKRRKEKARALAQEHDAIRQSVDEDNRVNFDAAHQLLHRNPRMTLKEAKRLACNI